jgi:hypothetical protein
MHMRTGFSRLLGGLACAVIIGSLTAATAIVSAHGDPDRSRRRHLEGSWWVNVTLLSDCVARKPTLSFPALLTFAEGGTLTGTTTNPAFAIGQRSPDHGVWTRENGPHRYRASTVALILFATNPESAIQPGIPDRIADARAGD